MKLNENYCLSLFSKTHVKNWFKTCVFCRAVSGVLHVFTAALVRDGGVHAAGHRIEDMKYKAWNGRTAPMPARCRGMADVRINNHCLLAVLLPDPI